ncbi:hypothetical protein BDW67DRAFT_149314 [Aspergillus spinulosporus]
MNGVDESAFDDYFHSAKTIECYRIIVPASALWLLWLQFATVEPLVPSWCILGAVLGGLIPLVVQLAITRSAPNGAAATAQSAFFLKAFPTQ